MWRGRDSRDTEPPSKSTAPLPSAPASRKRLRVLVIGPPGPDFFADNLTTCLVDAGHDARSVAAFRGPLARFGRLTARLQRELDGQPRAARRLQSHVVEATERFRPDIVVNLDFRLAYPVVAEIRSASGGPVVFWFPDPPGNVRNETFLLAPYDALFFKDTTQVARYRDTLGVNAHVLLEGCNPRWHRPTGPLAPPSDQPTVVVAGNMYVTRFRLLQRLMEEGISVVVHGPSWSRWLPSDSKLRAAYSGHLVLREDKARAFRAASVLLNNVTSHEADGMNARLFEGAACGAIVLNEYRARLPTIFHVGTEVAAYRDFRQLVSEVRRLSSLPQSERLAMSQAASMRAHAEHTLADRFQRIIQIAGRG